MGPQRTTRRLVSAHHHPHEIPEMFLRRHPMLTRSMAPTQPEPTHRNGGSFQEPAPAPTCRNRDSFQEPAPAPTCRNRDSLQEPAPAPTHRTRGSSQETTSFSSALDTTNNTPSIEHSQSHSSREVSSLLSLADSITTSLHNRITQSHFLQEISNSSFSSVSNVSLPLDFFQGSSSHEAPHPPSIVNITGSDGFDVITSMGELPSKPSVPEELLANFDQSFVRDLDMFNTRSRRLFDEQKESLDFTKKLIDISTHQCIELRAINHLRRGIRKLEHCCPFCNDLAWSPHSVDTPLVQGVSIMSDNDLSSLARYSNVQYAVFPSVENLFHLY
ncbi:hypothetical protein GG344DRAFT_81350 [Lentinula edodes]|nr:hypothetical protein GG344DRAFT_81350 [Lentinula edodes]